MIRLEQMTASELEHEHRRYGLSGASLGPAVVSVNAVVASLAVTQFMAYATGIRQAAAHLVYRGDLSRVTLSKDLPVTGVRTARG